MLFPALWIFPSYNRAVQYPGRKVVLIQHLHTVSFKKAASSRVKKRCNCIESFLFSIFKNTSWLWRAWRIRQNLLVWLREAASGNATQAAVFAFPVSTVWNTLPSLHLGFQTFSYSYLTLSHGMCLSTELSFRYLIANDERSGLKRTLM